MYCDLEEADWDSSDFELASDIEVDDLVRYSHNLTIGCRNVRVFGDNHGNVRVMALDDNTSIY